jgi:hypothetical protein
MKEKNRIRNDLFDVLFTAVYVKGGDGKPSRSMEKRLQIDYEAIEDYIFGLLEARSEDIISYIKGEIIKKPVDRDEESYNEGLEIAIKMIQDTKL